MEAIAGFIQNNPSLAVLAVFIGGLISSASPCVLALVPLVIGYVGGYSEGNRKKAVKYTVIFALGLSVTFTLMGAAAGFVGSILISLGSIFYWVIAVLIIVMGLSLLGLFEINLPFRSKMQLKTGGLIGAFFMGVLFGLFSAPCATPVLVVILTFAAAKGQIFYSTFLLFVYAIGHCVLLVAAGIATSFVESVIGSHGAAGFSKWSKKISGALIIFGGLYILYLNM